MAHVVLEADSTLRSPSHQKATVVIGDRIYAVLGWTRKDTIWLGGRKIGHIALSHVDRTGTTFSINGKRHKGRALDWCVQEVLAAEKAKVRALLHLPQP